MSDATALTSSAIDPSEAYPRREFFSMQELAERWRCSRGTVYNRLRAEAVKVLDFSRAGKKGKKLVPVSAVHELESRNLKKLM